METSVLTRHIHIPRRKKVEEEIRRLILDLAFIVEINRDGAHASTKQSAYYYYQGKAQAYENCICWLKDIQGEQQ